MPVRDRLVLVDRAGHVGLDRVVVDLGEGRGHHEQRQEEREAQEHLVGRQLRDADGAPEQRQHDDDPGEAGRQQQDRRRTIERTVRAISSWSDRANWPLPLDAWPSPICDRDVRRAVRGAAGHDEDRAGEERSRPMSHGGSPSRASA